MAAKDIGDIDKIRQTIESWLAAKLAGAETLALSELKFPESSGESSVTLLLDTETRGEQRKFVFRMVPPHSDVFDSHDIGLQYTLMEIMAQAGIPVPSLVGYEADKSLVGSDFYVMNFIEGQIPADNPPFAFGSWVTELDDSQRAAMWRHGLEVLAEIHAVDIGQYSLPGLPQAEPGQSLIQHEIDKFDKMLDREMIEHASPALAPVLQEAMATIKAHAPLQGPLRLCWGDSRVGNIIWSELRPAAVIDWEMANLGDPLQDVSWWFWVDYINSVGLGVERLGGLPTLEDIYLQWHQLTGLPIDNTDYYDLFSVLRYAIILERKLAAMKAAGMGVIDNFAAVFLPDLIAKCRAV
jgi:aminoglycoside phosphotransferase (APT) family kinase protein